MLARLVVHLQSNYSSLQNGLTQTAQKAAAWRQQINAAGGALAQMGQRAGAAVASIARVGAAIAGAAVKGAGLALLGGLAWGGKMAAEAEQAQVAFSTLLRNGDVAKQVLSQIQQFAAETPFALSDLREGAQNLLAFGVSSGEVMGKLRMLGDIAAGTGKPIGDFAQIFGKVKATGKVSLEALNQLAERGVPIYSALADTLGVSRDEMMKMISSGKVGFAQLDAALQSTTATGGIFAGGMAAQSQTVTGLISTLTDGVGEAFMSLAQILMDAFDFKAILAGGIAFASTAKSWFTALTPIIQQFAKTATAWFTYAYEFWSGILSSLFGGSSVTFSGIAAVIVKALAMAEFGFTNWRDVATLAMLQIGVGFLAFIGGFSHFFTTTLPAYLSYFAGNFTSVFLNVFDYVTTIFINLGQNIRNIMSEIWDFIASGGTNSLELAWTPLTDGFVNTLKEMEEIPAREIGPLEASMQKQIDSLSGTLNQGMEGLVAERLKALDDFNSQAPPQLPDVTAQTDQPAEDGTGVGDNKDNKPTALAKGSADAFSAIYAAMRANENAAAAKLQQQTALAATRTAVATETIATKLSGTPQLAMIEAFP